MTTLPSQQRDVLPTTPSRSVPTYDPILDLEVILGLIGTARSMVAADLSKTEKGTTQFSLEMEALDFLDTINREAYDAGTIQSGPRETVETFIRSRDYSVFQRPAA